MHMFGRSRSQTVKDKAGEGGAVALELAKDAKFRKELAAAFAHAVVARDRARSRIGPLATINRLATDDVLRDEIRELGEHVQKATGRVEKKRRPARGRLFLLTGTGIALVAIPQTRSWLMQRLSGLTDRFTGASGGPKVISETIEVELPVSTVYNQWTQFEDFPQFMEGVEEVRQLDDTRLHWIAKVGGRRAEWDAKILEQHPDRQISWVSEDGRATRGTVTFEELAPARTRVQLSMSYMTQGPRELIGSAAGLDERRVRGDLQRFKDMIEARNEETGAWRGEVVAGETR
jgi:uncharacterized membrane protein